MSRRIDTVEARSKLAARRAPYWVRLVPGCSLGYRKLVAGTAGVWLARVWDGALQKDTCPLMSGMAQPRKLPRGSRSTWETAARRIP